MAAEIGFPVMIKPNIGGRGAGIVRLNSAVELARAIASSQINLGIDHTALVQEVIPLRGGHISRVENRDRRCPPGSRRPTADPERAIPLC